jgi:hypothetical protein
MTGPFPSIDEAPAAILQGSLVAGSYESEARELNSNQIVKALE